LRSARYTGFPVLGLKGRVPSFSLGNLPSQEKGYCINQYQVFMVYFLGYQYCPWGCKNANGDFDFLILNRNSGQSFAAPELIIHLIRNHEFFEGHESPYRLDPERAVQVLEIFKSKTD
jgi:hypothetical protein